MNTDSSRPSPGYESFFAPLQVSLDAGALVRVHQAYCYAALWHAGQTRADDRPYFEHPEIAAWIYIHELGGRDVRTITALLLHDVVEDTHISFRDMARIFDIDTALDVNALSRLPNGAEEIPEYLGRIIDRGACAILAKLCEHLHNMDTLNACILEKRKRKHDDSRSYHKPLLVTALRKCGPEWIEPAEYLEAELERALRRVILQ